MLWINIVGILLIVFIAWWFWGYREQATQATDNEVTIIVNNGVYQPARIAATAGQPLTLKFTRYDDSPCANMVVFDKLGISKELAQGKTTSLTITPDAPGEIAFTCQMQMYRGVIDVQPAQ